MPVSIALMLSLSLMRLAAVPSPSTVTVAIILFEEEIGMILLLPDALFVRWYWMRHTAKLNPS